jgi:large subunit ribosomal protein L24e
MIHMIMNHIKVIQSQTKQFYQKMQFFELLKPKSCSLTLDSFLFSISTAELCALSEYRIYPGNGKLFIRRDGKPVFLGSSKAYSLTLQRKKPAKLVWTQAWRRLHKKGLSETATKKRARRVNKVSRAVVGLSLDEITKKASLKPEVRTAQREAALKEIKARKAASKGKTSRTGNSVAAGQRTKVPKNVIRINRGSTGR